MSAVRFVRRIMTLAARGSFCVSMCGIIEPALEEPTTGGDCGSFAANASIVQVFAVTIVDVGDTWERFNNLICDGSWRS